VYYGKCGNGELSPAKARYELERTNRVATVPPVFEIEVFTRFSTLN